MKITLNKTASLIAASFLCLLLFSFASAQELQRRGFTGVQVGAVPDETRAKLSIPKGGVLVLNLVEGGSAKDADLQPNDVITRINDHEIFGAEDYAATVTQYLAGDKITIHFVRNGKTIINTVALKPRPYEKDSEVDTFYQSIAVDGALRRAIVTAPKESGKHPAILYVTGIGCFSQEAADLGTTETKLLYGLTKAGYVTMRVEKSGIGDSRGKACNDPAVDMQAEIRGYLEGLKSLRQQPFVDADKIFIIGLSIGGIEAPQIAARVPVKGLIVVNTVGKPFMEYLIDTRRRQMSLRKFLPDELDRRAALNELCNHRLLIEKQTPERLLKDLPNCKEFVEYPAPYTFMQQWAAINIGEMWKRIAVPTLVVVGKSDYIATVSDSPLLVNSINSFHPGQATLVEIDGMDHFMSNAASMEESMSRTTGLRGEFKLQVLDAIKQWLRKQTVN